MEDLWSGLILLALIAGGIYAYRYYRHATARVVPPEMIVVLLPFANREDMARARRILRAGERYHPYRNLNDDFDLSFSLLPQTDLVGRYAVTWRIADPEKFVRCRSIAGIYSVVPPRPIQNFQTLLKANPSIDFTTYAPDFGIEILKVEPPIGNIETKPGILIGLCTCHGEAIPLKDEDRKQHTYIAGKTKSGKSTLLLNMALQDIRSGKGVAFLDPHGDTVQRLLDLIPRERAQDVISPTLLAAGNTGGTHQAGMGKRTPLLVLDSARSTSTPPPSTEDTSPNTEPMETSPQSTPQLFPISTLCVEDFLVRLSRLLASGEDSFHPGDEIENVPALLASTRGGTTRRLAGPDILIRIRAEGALRPAPMLRQWTVSAKIGIVHLTRGH